MAAGCGYPGRAEPLSHVPPGLRALLPERPIAPARAKSRDRACGEPHTQSVPFGRTTRPVRPLEFQWPDRKRGVAMRKAVRRLRLPPQEMTQLRLRKKSAEANQAQTLATSTAQAISHHMQHFSFLTLVKDALASDPWSRIGASRSRSRIMMSSSSAAADMGWRRPITSPRSSASQMSRCLEKSWLGSGNVGRNTTAIRSNYLLSENQHFYEAAMKMWEGLSQELNYNVMFSQRGVLNIGHSPAQMDGYRPARQPDAPERHRRRAVHQGTGGQPPCPAST